MKFCSPFVRYLPLIVNVFCPPRQRFIQQLNYCSMEEIDELRWSLCTIAMNTAHLSFECVVLLAERLRWLQEENTGEIDEEELESFYMPLRRGMF